LEIARAAACSDAEACTIRDVVWSATAEAGNDGLSLALDIASVGDTRRCSLRAPAGDVCYASATIERKAATEERVDLAALAARCDVSVDGKAFYEMLAQRGFAYGAAFRAVEQLSI